MPVTGSTKNTPGSPPTHPGVPRSPSPGPGPTGPSQQPAAPPRCRGSRATLNRAVGGGGAAVRAHSCGPGAISEAERAAGTRRLCRAPPAVRLLQDPARGQRAMAASITHPERGQISGQVRGGGEEEEGEAAAFITVADPVAPLARTGIPHFGDAEEHGSATSRSTRWCPRRGTRRSHPGREARAGGRTEPFYHTDVPLWLLALAKLQFSSQPLRGLPGSGV